MEKNTLHLHVSDFFCLDNVAQLRAEQEYHTLQEKRNGLSRMLEKDENDLMERAKTGQPKSSPSKTRNTVASVRWLWLHQHWRHSHM
jgi:hypothetical protein